MSRGHCPHTAVSAIVVCRWSAGTSVQDSLQKNSNQANHDNGMAAHDTDKQHERARERIKVMEDTRKQLLEEIYNSQKNYSKYYDGSKRDIDKDLKPGAQVWLRFEGFELDGLKLKGTSAKLRPRFVGPFVIKEQVSDVSFRIKLPQTKIDSGLHDVFHSQLCAASQPIAAPLLIDRCNACIGPACGPLTFFLVDAVLIKRP